MSSSIFQVGAVGGWQRWACVWILAGYTAEMQCFGRHPVLIFLLATVSLLAMSLLPGPRLPWSGGWGWGLGGIVMVLGSLWNLVQARRFRRAGTGLRPLGQPRQLVTQGAYAWSRNPMYCGQLLILGGWWLGLGAWYGLGVLPLTWLVFDRLVIPAEERLIAVALPEAWQDYRQQVRRWCGRYRRRATASR